MEPEQTPSDYHDVTMLAVRKILKISPQALSVLKNTPSCNLDLVRRTAKDVRDPNPLITTMECMARKYPIAAVSHKLKDLSPPHDLISPQTDNHNRDRRLVKKELVNWWIQHAPLPTDEHRLEQHHPQVWARTDDQDSRPN